MERAADSTRVHVAAQRCAPERAIPLHQSETCMLCSSAGGQRTAGQPCWCSQPAALALWSEASPGELCAVTSVARAPAPGKPVTHFSLNCACVLSLGPAPRRPCGAQAIRGPGRGQHRPQAEDPGKGCGLSDRERLDGHR
jgi:hypothetical protein